MIDRNVIGFECLLLGLSLSLISYTILFSTSHLSEFCITSVIAQPPINNTKLLNCVTDHANTDMPYYYLGFAGYIFLAGSAVLLSPIKFKPLRRKSD